jgi:hypothetical protein
MTKHRIHVLSDEELQKMLEKHKPSNAFLIALQALQDRRPRWDCQEHRPPWITPDNRGILSDVGCYRCSSDMPIWYTHLKCELTLMEFIPEISQTPNVYRLDWRERQWNTPTPTAYRSPDNKVIDSVVENRYFSVLENRYFSVAENRRS